MISKLKDILEIESNSSSDTAKLMIIERRVVLEIPVQVTVTGKDIYPLESVAKTGRTLPGKIAFPRADIQMKGNEPFGAQRYFAPDPNLILFNSPNHESVFQSTSTSYLKPTAKKSAAY